MYEGGVPHGGLAPACTSAHARNGHERYNIGQPRPRKNRLCCQGVDESIFVRNEIVLRVSTACLKNTPGGSERRPTAAVAHSLRTYIFVFATYIQWHFPGLSSGRLFDPGTPSRGTQVPRDETVLFLWDVATAGRICVEISTFRWRGSRMF